MNYSWSKTVFPIAAIFSFRMFGLFMLLPVFTIMTNNLEGATPALIGLALGIYGLSQGLLQMPFGLFSDKYGRSKMISLGLLLFFLGSLLGALTHSIYGIIFARLLQGMGAIGSVLIALLADLTLEQDRTKAMAVIGSSIGISFAFAMILSPAIAQSFGLSGIFYVSAIFALLGLILLHRVIPKPKLEFLQPESLAKRALIKTVMTNKNLLGLNAGIFFQHLILTANFYAIPLLVKEDISQGLLTESWHFYLPVMFFSFILMVPCLIFAERKRQVKSIFLAAVFVMALMELSLSFFYHSWVLFCLSIFVYFIAFNILEAFLPSLVSRLSTANSKGTAMGIYSSCQFLGLFVGGVAAGIIFKHFSFAGIFMMSALLSFLWLLLACFMRPLA